MVCSASCTRSGNHLSFSTKAWYAAFLLSKNSLTGPELLKKSRCFSTKAWYAAFLLSKNLSIGPIVSRTARDLFFNKSLVCSFSSFEKPDHGCSAFADWLRPIPECGI